MLQRQRLHGSSHREQHLAAPTPQHQEQLAVAAPGLGLQQRGLLPWQATAPAGLQIQWTPMECSV